MSGVSETIPFLAFLPLHMLFLLPGKKPVSSLQVLILPSLP